MNILFKKYLRGIVFLLLALITLINANSLSAQSFSKSDGNWDNAPTNLWATTAPGLATKTVPLAADAVTIQAGNTITVNPSTSYTCASLTVTGNLVFSAGAQITVTGAVTGVGNIDMSAGGTLIIGGASFSTTGTFTAGTGTVIFNGGNQTVRGTTYNNLTFSNANTKTLSGSIVVNGTFTSSQNITGTTFDFTANGSVVHTGGVFNTIGSVTYNSGLAQDIIPGTHSGSMTLSSAGAKTLRGATTVAGAFNMSSSLSCGANNMTLNGAVNYTSGTLTVGANTFTYGSASAQGIITTTYGGALTLSGGGAKTLSGATIVTGAFSLASPNTLNCSGFDLTLSGNITAGTSTGTLTTGANTVTYNRANTQNIFGTTYNNLVLGGSNTKTLSAAVVVNGTTTVNTGTVACGTNDFTLNGAVSWTAGTITTGANTVTYNSASSQDVIPGTYSNILSLSGAGAKTLRGATTVAGAFNMSSSLSCGANNMTLNGAVNYTSGTLTVGANTFTYGSASAQSIISTTYGGALTLSGGGAKTLSGATIVTGAFSLASPNTLNCSGFDLTLSGDITAGTSTGTLTTGANTVTYNRANTQNIFGTTYNNLVLGGSNTKTLSAAVVVNGNTTVNTGTVACGANDLTLNGAVSWTAGTITTGANTVTYNSASSQDVIPGTYSNILSLSSAGAKTLRGGTTVTGAFNMSSSLSCGANNMTLNGAVNYTSGTLTVGVNTFTYGSASAQTIIATTYGGALTLSGGAGGPKTLSGATIVTGAFSLASPNTLNCSGFNLTLSGATTATGSLTTGANTVTYSGTVAQNIFATTYNNLTLSGNAVKTLVGTTVTNGSLTIGASSTLQLSTFNFTANSFTNISGTLTDNNVTGTNLFVDKVTVALGGNFNNTGNPSFTFQNGIENNGTFTTSGTGQVVFNTNSQALSGNAAMNFNNTAGLLINGITVTNGNTNTVAISGILNGTNPSSIWINGANATLNYLSTSTMFTGGGSIDATANPNTVNYALNGTQNIIATTYHNLTISSGGTKTALGNFTLNNDLTISAGTLDLSNTGTAFNVGGAANIVGILNFGTGVAKTLNITGNLSGAGTINTNTSALLHVINLSGASNSIGTFTSSAVASIVNYNRVGNQTIFVSPNYRVLNLNGSGIKSIQGTTSVNADIVIPNNITLNLNSNTLNTSGNITIDAGATLDVNANATLTLATTRNIANSGTLRVVGTPGNIATISRNVAGNYSITQAASTAVIFANYYLFDYLNGGIVISNGTINSTDNFSNGTFSNGIGSQYLNLNGLNFTSFTASNTIFNAGPTFNVTRTSGTGTITFQDASGTLAGENNDNDNANPGTLINWSNPVATFYSQGSLGFSVNANWAKNPGGGGGSPVEADFTNGLSTFIIQNTHNVTLDRNIDVLVLTVGGGTSGSLTIGNDVTARTMVVRQDYNINNGASVTAGNFDATHSLDIKGNFTNNGTFNLHNNVSRLVNTTFSGTTTQLFGTTSPTFSSITFANPSNINAGVALNIAGNLTLLANSVFQDGNLTHTIQGNWVDGTTGVRTGSGTIVFNGSSQSITTASTFHNVTFNGGSPSNNLTGAVVLTGNLLVTNNTTLLANTNVIHNIAGSFTVNAGSTFTHSSGTIVFDGSTAQTIDVNNATFTNITFSNGGVPSPKTIIGGINQTSGTLLINSTASVDGNGSHRLYNLTQEGSCTFNNTINFLGGTINNTLSGSINLGTANLIIFSGTTTLASSKSLTYGGNLTINTSATLNVDNSTITNLSGSFTMQPNSTIQVRGANNFPSFATYSLDATSNTFYDANLVQTIRAISYGNLTLSNNTKNATVGSLDINGSLTLNNNVTANFSFTSHTIAGNINNALGSSFNSTGTITMDNPNADQTIGAGGTYSFNNLTFTNTAPTLVRTKTISTAIPVSGNFSVTNTGGNPGLLLNLQLGANVITGGAGSFSIGANVLLLTSGTNSFSTTITSFTTRTLNVLSIVRFTNTTIGSDQVIPNNVTYGSIEFSGAGAPDISTKTAAGALDINGNISSSGGEPRFIDGGFAHTIAGNWNLAGVFYPSPSSTITLDGTAQAIGPANSNLNFFNIVFGGSGIKTFANTNNGSAINVLNDLTINSGVTVDINDKLVNISGNWSTTGSGSFTQIATTSFIGTTANQTINMTASSFFGNIAINKTNVSFQTVTANTDIQVSRTLNLIANNANFVAGANTISIGRNFIYNTGTSFSTSGTFLFNGNTFSQDLTMNATGATFNNLSFSGTQTKTLNTNDITVNGNLSIIGSTIFNGNNRQITVLGNWNNGGTFQHTSTVNFTGGNQSISSSSFNSVNFAGTLTKTLTGNITLGANLNIVLGSTLDVSASNYTVSVEGNWTNAGLFNARQGTVNFNGNTKNITTGGTGVGFRFYNVTLGMTAGQVATLQTNPIEIQNNFTINSGTFATGANNISVGNDMIVAGVFNQGSNASVLTFNPTSAGSRTFNPGNSVSNVYRAITINGNSGAIINLNSNPLTITNGQAITVTSGTLKSNSNFIFCTGNININGANGVLDLDAATSVYMSNGTSINNTAGTLRIVGTVSQYVTILRNGGIAGEGYTINQSSGTIHAQYYSIQNTITSGVSINGGSIDATNNFSNGSFSNGVGTQYLLLSGTFTFTSFTANNTVFNSGPTNNVTRTSGTGIITFNASTGDLAGPGFENDSPDGFAATGFIRWTSFGKRWSNASADNNWNNPLNWSPAGVPLLSDTVYLDHGIIPLATAYTVNITSANANAVRLIIDRQGGAAINLVMNNGMDLTVAENINILNGNTVTVTDNTNIINIGGNWLNAGTFNNGSSTINFTGGSSGNTISTGSSSLFNVNINGGGTYTLTAAATFAGSLNISSGTLDVGAGSNTLSVGGNWTNSGLGVFNAQTGTVILNGSGTQTISGGPFYDLTTSTGGTKQLLNSLTVNRNLTIGASTILDAGTNIVFVKGNWLNNSSSAAFLQTGVGSVFIDGLNQTIGGTFSTTFNNLTLAGVANNTKTLGVNIVVNGDMVISSSAQITLNSQAFTITGSPSKSFSLQGISILTLQGANNFPSNFGTYDLSSTSTVNYQFNAAQSIFATTYGNLNLTTLAPVALNTKTALGNLIVQGGLTISDVNLQLNMNNFDMTLAGNLAFPPSGRQILWGTGMFTHNGGGWNIDVDYTGFSPDFGNVTLSGTGNKAMLANLNIAGNFTVQSGVTLTMNTFLLTSTGVSRTFTLSNGATLNCNVVAPELAFPKNFTTNIANVNSTVTLNGASDQLVNSAVNYGILNLSNNAVNNTLTGNTVISGDFNTRASTLVDNNFNLTLGGAVIDIRNYTPSATSLMTLNGATQFIYDGVGGGAPLDLRNITCSNAGTKTIGLTGGGAANIVNVSGNVSIASGVTVTSNRIFNYSGNSWVNSGTFNHTANTFTFNGSGLQVINPGVSNSYQQVVFNNTLGDISFVSNGGNFANTGVTGFVVNLGVTVNMGSGLTHRISGTVINNGTWNTNNANFNFNGGGQTITTPTFIAQNITTSGSGTKTMGCDWSINDLNISVNTTLETTVLNAYNITLTGNWLNEGGFNSRTNTVSFESNNTSPRSITSGGANFNIVRFNQALTSTRTYTLISPITVFADQLTMGSGATLNLNSKILTLGSNNAIAEVHNINAGATLNVNANATLRFNNDNGNSTLNVAGKLITVGTSGNIATITRATGSANRININVTGSINANYYFYEFISNAGFNIASSATVDPIENLSNGTWSNLNTAGGAPKYYLVLEAAVATPISNLTFNFGATPVVGTHFNVARSVSAIGVVTFADPISGILGSFQYEEDPTGPSSPSATTGKCIWPIVVEAVWTGGAGTRNWHTPGNWSTAAVPTALVDVTIPDVTFDPLISLANAECRNLRLTTGILDITGGFDLEVNKDVSILTNPAKINILNSGSNITVAGAWTNNLGTGSFNPGGAKVTFTGASGAYTISPGVSPFFNVDFNGTSSNFDVNAPTMNIDGSLNIINGTVYPRTINYNINIKGDFINTGYFNPSAAGTITLNGTGAQSISNFSIRNLVVSGSGIKTALGNDTINGTLTVNNGATLVSSLGNVLYMLGNVTINSGGSFNDGTNQHFFRGVTWTGTGNWEINTGTIVFDRPGDQTIAGGKFNNLILEGGGNKFLTGDVALNADFTLRSIVGSLFTNTFLLSSSTGTSNFTMEPNTNMYIRGANNCPSNFATFNVDPISNTFYDATINQLVGGFTYGNLILNTINTKTLSGDINVIGNLAINTATLDVSTSNYNIFVTGDFNNNLSGSFIARNGTVTMSGASNNIIYSGASGTKTFYNLVIDKSSASLSTTINRDLTILNDLTSITGIYSSNTFITTVGNNLIATSGQFANSGTYLLNKVSGAANIQTNNSNLLNITINSGGIYTLLDNLTISGSFNLISGTFDGNGKQARLGTGASATTIAGVYKVGAGGVLALSSGNNCTVTSTGTLELVGTVGNLALVTIKTTGTYNLTIDGTIKANYYQFENMSSSGILLSSLSTIDATDNLSNGSFTNGVAGGTMLRIENNQTLTINNVSFPINPGGIGPINVAKATSVTGVVTFNLASGVFSGESFENDPTNLINWTGPITLTWDGSFSSSWFDADNWTASSGPNIVPTGAEDVKITSAGFSPQINFDGAKARKLTVSSGVLSVNSPLSPLPDFTVSDDLLINGGTLVLSGANDSLFVAGNFNLSSGSFTSGTSTVFMKSPSGTKTITSVPAFNNLVLDSTSNFQLGANLTVNGNLSILQGAFDVTSSNFSISLRGNWNNLGSFNSRTGIVTFNANSVGTRTINSGGSSFNTLVFSPIVGVTYQIASNPLSTKSNISLNSGTLDLNSQTLNLGDNIGSDNINIFGTLEIDANAALKVGINGSILTNSGGRIKILGSSWDNPAIVSRQTSGNYSFIVNSGATIETRFYQIEDLNLSGLLVSAGATIHPTNNFSKGTFTNGAAGGTYLDLRNTFAPITIDSVVFNTGPSFNCTRTIGSGEVTFNDATGGLAGFNFENDDNSPTTGLVRWTYTFPQSLWTGNDNTLWNNPLNWDNGVPSLAISAIIPDVSSGSNRYPVLTSGLDGFAKDLTLFSPATLTLGGAKNLTVDGGVIVSSGATFTVSTGSNSTINVKDQWTVSGTFNDGGASTVNMTIPSGTKSITMAGTNKFYNLQISNASGGSSQTNSSITVTNNLNITSGTFRIGNSAHIVTVSGNWTKSASANFVSSAGKVILTKPSGTQTISGTGNTFFNLDLVGNSTKLLANSINIDGGLYLAPNATLNAGANNIAIRGNWNNAGRQFIPGTGTVTFNGTTSQSISRISGELFYNMTINNSAGVTVAKPVVVNRVLTLTNGTLTTGGQLELNFSTGGAIDPSGSGAVSGIFEVARTFNITSPNFWHYIGTPLLGTTFAEINNDLPLLSNNLYYYQENVPTQNLFGWKSTLSVPVPIPLTTLMNQQRNPGGPTDMVGYGLKFPAGTRKITLAGTYNHSTSTRSTGALSYTSSGLATADGWQLVSNPYPSHIDWNLVNLTNIDPTITYYNNTGGVNATYLRASGFPGVSTNGATQFVPAMQAFWVQTLAGGGSVSVPRAARVVNPVGGVSFYRLANKDIKTMKVNVSNVKCSDDAVVRFGLGATEKYDLGYDAYKFDNDAGCPNIYFVVDTAHLVINSLPPFTQEKAIPLNFEVSVAGANSFTIKELDNFKDMKAIILLDKQTNQSQNLLDNSTYNFSAKKGDAKERFVLTFVPAEEVLALNDNEDLSKYVNINAYQNKVSIGFSKSLGKVADISVTNAIGQEVYIAEGANISSGKTEFVVSKAIEAVYIVKVVVAGKSYTKEVILSR